MRKNHEGSASPQTKERLFTAASRRHKAAFATVSIVTIVEMGIHNLIGAVVGPQEEPEAVMAQQLWGQLPEEGLLLMDSQTA